MEVWLGGYVHQVGIATSVEYYDMKMESGVARKLVEFCQEGDAFKLLRCALVLIPIGFAWYSSLIILYISISYFSHITFDEMAKM
jgi:hypothetical protein